MAIAPGPGASCQCSIVPSIEYHLNSTITSPFTAGNGIHRTCLRSLSLNTAEVDAAQGQCPCSCTQPPADSFFKMYLAVPGLRCSRWDPGPCPGIEPRPPALGAHSLSHCTTREIPQMALDKVQRFLGWGSSPEDWG